MNCQKCNSPLNEGDKFCQVCGSVVESTTPTQKPEPMPNVVANPEVAAAPVENVVVTPTPSVAPAVATVPNSVTNAPMMSQPAPAPGPMPAPQAVPMSPIPAEPAKKNNTLVIVLIAVIGVLLIAVVLLVLNSGDKEKESSSANKGNTSTTTQENNKDDDKPTTPTPVDTSTKTVINEYTFILPEGYNAAEEDGEVILYDNEGQMQVAVGVIDGVFAQLDAEQTKSNIGSSGVADVTYNRYTRNNKQMIAFKGTLQGYTIEYIYVEYSPSKVLAAGAMYSLYDSHKENVYDILTKTTISESGYSNSTSFPVPGLTFEDAIK